MTWLCLELCPPSTGSTSLPNSTVPVIWPCVGLRYPGLDLTIHETFGCQQTTKQIGQASVSGTIKVPMFQLDVGNTILRFIFPKVSFSKGALGGTKQHSPVLKTVIRNVNLTEAEICDRNYPAHKPWRHHHSLKTFPTDFTGRILWSMPKMMLI